MTPLERDVVTRLGPGVTKLIDHVGSDRLRGNFVLWNLFSGTVVGYRPGDHIDGIRLEPTEWDRSRKLRTQIYVLDPWQSLGGMIEQAIQEAEEDGVGRRDEVRVVVAVMERPKEGVNAIAVVTVWIGFCAGKPTH